MIRDGAVTGVVPKGTAEKGKYITKGGKKYWKAPDGSLHTGQVSDYKTEKKKKK